MNSKKLNQESSYPLHYDFSKAQVEIKRNLQDNSFGLFNDAIFINGQPLTVQYESSGYRSIVTPYQTFSTLTETANAAVKALNGRKLNIFQHEGRLGHLPEGLPDLDSPGPPRVRKNILDMTEAECDLFIQAIWNIKSNINHPYRFAYDEFVKVHLDIMSNSDWGGHGDALLPWHRIFIYHFESLLRAQPGFENVTIPYWDWTEAAQKGILPFTDQFIGGAGNEDINDYQTVHEGPFAEATGWTIASKDPDNPTILKRAEAHNIFGSPLNEPTKLSEALTSNNYSIFYNIISELHSNIHTSLDGTMGTMASPGDPIFWLHHGMIDKVWADWQDLHPGIPHYESVKLDNPVEPDTPLQPWLVDIDRNITTNDLLDYRRLYIYD